MNSQNCLYGQNTDTINSIYNRPVRVTRLLIFATIDKCRAAILFSFCQSAAVYTEYGADANNKSWRIQKKYELLE